jgi:purine-binding chemotaxis protein CheW
MSKENAYTEKQLVLFGLDSEIYGVDISDVHEIIRMQPVTKVPKAPFYVEGIINLRGKVIPVVDIRKRFGLSGVEQTKDSRIVVVDIGGTTIGMIVDEVTEVIRIPSDSIEPPSEIVAAGDSDYLLGIARVDERMVILLDLDRLLPKSEMNHLEGVLPADNGQKGAMCRNTVTL